ncbi:hypothetical protein C0585_01630 [Candidatus Woesearchaeota archaeon]|nr:MAG: hypothetical protein C0585_01630 [Candidatus Woesearchaeota archaeon]
MEKLFRIDGDKCEACEKCVQICRQGVFEMIEEDGKIHSEMVHPEKCNDCGLCFMACENQGKPILLKNEEGHECLHKKPKEEELLLN